MSSNPARPVHAACLTLLLIALALLLLLVGGARLTFCLPSYGLLAMAAWISPWVSRRFRSSPKLYCAAAMGLFLGYLLVRAWFSPVPYLARTDTTLVLAVAVVYGLTTVGFAQSKTRWIVVGTLLGLALCQALLGTVQFIKGHTLTLFGVAGEVDYGWRASGFYICPNHLAGFLEMAIPLGLSLVLWSRLGVAAKLAAGYAVTMSLGALLMTGSRGGYISLAFGLSAFGVLSLLALKRMGHPRFGLALGTMIILLILATVGIGYFVSKSAALQARAAMLDPASDARFEIWQAAILQFKEAPVLGTGGGSFLYYGRRFTGQRVQADPVHVHNDYLELLAEYGLVGGVLFLCCFAAHLVSGWKAFCGLVSESSRGLGGLPGHGLALNIGALSALLALTAHSAIDFNLHLPATALVMAFVLGICANPGSELSQSRSYAPWLAGYLRWVPPLAAMVLAITGFSTWPGEFFAERARMAYRDGDFPRAADLAARGLAWDTRNPYLHLYVGQSKAELATFAAEDEPKALRWWAEAAEAFKEGLVHFPQEQWLLLGLAEALDELSQPQAAQNYYEEAVRWAPHSASVRAQFALHLHRNGRLDEAQAQYHASQRLHGNSMAVVGLEQLAEERAAAQK